MDIVTSPVQPTTTNKDATPHEVLPFAILMDELKHEDIAVRLMAVRRLSTIALALGPDRSRTEIVPFLEESTDDEDEVLKALAEELGNFVELMGGPSYAHILLPALETLAAVEETVVRNAAVDSIGKIATSLSSQQVDESLVPLIKRLSTGEWFTSKVSACGLYHHAYELARTDIKPDLRKFFANLSRDDTPMVRRSASTNLPLDMDSIQNEIFPIFAELAADDQDSVRLLTIPIFLALAECIDLQVTKSRLVPTLLRLISDKSWRVRYMAANNYLSIIQSLSGTLTPVQGAPMDISNEPVDMDLVNAYVGLLRDLEAEVRQAASSQIPGVAAQFHNPGLVLSTIVPCVKDLVIDSNQHVRASIAQRITSLAPILGMNDTIEHLLDLLLQLLKDEFSEVRLNLISKLEHVNHVIGIEFLAQSLLPAIVELAEDKQWRVRAAIIEYMPLLAQQLGNDFFDDKLGPLCMTWLSDPVFAIREAACLNLSCLANVFGMEWTRDVLLPQVIDKASESNYLSRMTTVHALMTLAPLLHEELLQNPVIPTIATLAEDSIPNIRFNVAKAIETLSSTTLRSAHISESIVQILKKLSADKDSDVRFFAMRALNAASAVAG